MLLSFWQQSYRRQIKHGLKCLGHFPTSSWKSVPMGQERQMTAKSQWAMHVNAHGKAPKWHSFQHIQRGQLNEENIRLCRTLVVAHVIAMIELRIWRVPEAFAFPQPDDAVSFQLSGAMGEEWVRLKKAKFWFNFIFLCFWSFFFFSFLFFRYTALVLFSQKSWSCFSL